MRAVYIGLFLIVFVNATFCTKNIRPSGWHISLQTKREIVESQFVLSIKLSKMQIIVTKIS